MRNDQIWYCPLNGDSCYYYNTTYATYATHKAACQAQGGYLASYNSGQEQSAVENRMAYRGNSYYWIGVEPTAQGQYVMLDGTPLNSGLPSTLNPYAHW